MRGSRRGFSLIELLVVVAIIGLMAALAVPAFNNIAASTNIVRAGESINDQLVLARQSASGRNLPVELRLVEETSAEATGGSPGYMALQIWGYEKPDGELKPLRRAEVFPTGVIVNPRLSPLLDATAAVETGTTRFGALGNRSYKSIRIRADGRIGAQLAMSNACLTVQMKRDSRTDPQNYYTIQINPLTGRISYYRP